MLDLMVVDDEQLVLEGVCALLRADPGLRIVATASTGLAAALAAQTTRPQVALVDMRLPDLDGAATTRLIHQVAPHCAVIILSSFLDEEALAQAVRAGAVGYLRKTIEAEALRRAIVQVSTGGHAYDPQAQRWLSLAASGRLPPRVIAPARRPLALTDQEQRILRGLARGATNEELAQTLGISINTVKYHLRRLFDKLEVSNRRAALERARALSHEAWRGGAGARLAPPADAGMAEDIHVSSA